MIYNIYEITGKFATDCDSGQELYDLIYPHLNQGESVELDFTGVSIFASAFFNYAIGQLLQHEVIVDQLNHLLTFKALSPMGHKVLKRVVDNAKQYYADPQYRQAVDTVLEEYAASL